MKQESGIKKSALTRWTTEDATQLYGVREWGQGFFGVSDSGEVVLHPDGKEGPTQVSLSSIVTELKQRGLDMPVLLRFGNVLDAAIRNLHTSFQRAIREAGYRGPYRGVYPIKVNQQQQVVEDVLTYGRAYHHGLEAGSKAELIAALALTTDPEALVICNGYKDAEFIDLALYAQKMGLKTVLVVEMPNELSLILERADRMGVEPMLGLRAKLSVRGMGNWSESAGDLSMFGLTASQVIDMVDLLREAGKTHCLQMLHYHVGSQIPNIRSIRAAIQEASRFYTDLVKEGCRMGYLNVGGGLAVDYDGSHTNFPSSCNYDVNEYAADIVEAIMGACDASSIDHPAIVSESGRATVAHHAVLLFNILDVTRLESHSKPDALPDDAHEMVKNLMSVTENLTSKNAQECYHDAVFYRDQVRSLFNIGSISLRERAQAEKIFWNIVNRISTLLRDQKYVPDELSGLVDALADIYHCNFSVFQSLPDAWAIEQLFPVVPIHRLDEMPERQATLSDITCDCDGRIKRFVDMHDVRQSLPVHALNGHGEYVLGVFLVGAYQETLGDLHNLLGDTNVVGVRIEEDGSLDITREISGDTVADVLSYVEYDTDEIMSRLRDAVQQATRAGRVDASESREIVEAFEEGLQGYTYFEG